MKLEADTPKANGCSPPSVKTSGPALAPHPAISLDDDLSPNERVVLSLRCDFYVPKEIASKTGIPLPRVYEMLERVRNKFGALSTGEMCRRARLMGIGA